MRLGWEEGVVRSWRGGGAEQPFSNSMLRSKYAFQHAHTSSHSPCEEYPRSIIVCFRGGVTTPNQALSLSFLLNVDGGGGELRLGGGVGGTVE